jgi:FkbM family methyltransferase
MAKEYWGLKFIDEPGKLSVGNYFRQYYFFNYTYKGTVVEVGGGDPNHLCFSTHYKNNGWRCLIFEPNPYYAQKHREANNEVYELAISNKDEGEVDFTVVGHENAQMGWSGFYPKFDDVNPTLPQSIIKVKAVTLNTILSELNINKIDILHVDVEGWEKEVIEGIDFDKINVRFVVLEDYRAAGVYNEYMKSRGYKYLTNLHINFIYTKEKK